MLLGGLFDGHVGFWDCSAGNGVQRQASAGSEGSFMRVVGVETVESATLSGLLGVSSDGVATLWSQSALIDPLVSINLNSLVLLFGVEYYS